MSLTYSRATWFFLRALGAVYLMGFVSLAIQLHGLIGHDGILPAADLLSAARQLADARGLGSIGRFIEIPTVFWISASDTALDTACAFGAVLSALLIVGLWPVIVLPLLWLLYLSFSVVSREFLGYQWDALLLEAGALAVFVAPLARFDWPGRADPPRLARWMLWWLLFRLMFASGLVKLASGDPTWRSLTALTVHYETQPLPTPLAWWMHQLPRSFHRASTAVTLGLELGAPLLIFGPRRWRLVGCVLLIGLQLARTGRAGETRRGSLQSAICSLQFTMRRCPFGISSS